MHLSLAWKKSISGVHRQKHLSKPFARARCSCSSFTLHVISSLVEGSSRDSSSCQSRLLGSPSEKATAFDLFRKCATESLDTDDHVLDQWTTHQSAVSCSQNRSSSAKQIGFRFLLISTSTLFKERATAARTRPLARHSGERLQRG